MKTRMTEMLQIKYPIMNAGMSYIAVPELVAAVSNAGGLGLLATGNLSPEKTRESIRKIRELTDKPFGCNLTLLFSHGQENAKVALEEKVPVINWSLGRAVDIIKTAHNYGGRVLGTVTRVKHALGAQKDGADGLIVTGFEAAAHGEEVASLVLIPRIASAVKIPVIAAGGFSTGRGLVAALALGAEGVSMGTRFALTKESPLHKAAAEACLNADIDGTFVSEKIDGMLSRWLKTETCLARAKEHTSPISALKAAMKIKRTLGLSWPQVIQAIRSNARPVLLARLATGLAEMEAIIIGGDLKKACLPIGQTVGLIDSIITAREVIESVMKEAEETVKALKG